MRDADFNELTKRTLAQRVGHCCSRPTCRTLTSGPQVDPSKSLNIGVAAHISAASPGGPRYKPMLSLKERQEITNGIWLCQDCAKLIDNDPLRFTIEVLMEWKLRAETEALNLVGKTALKDTDKSTQDRHLSLAQANYLVQTLTPFNGQAVEIVFVLGDTESQIYAQEIAHTLHSAGWSLKRLVGQLLTFRGMMLTPQDPTDVPQGAEALVRALNDQGIRVVRNYVQPMSFEYNGNSYVPKVYLFVGKNGEPTPLPPKYSQPLLMPTLPELPADLKAISNFELAEVSEQMATVLRDYEVRNRRHFEAQWHIHGTPLEEDSYRGWFERVLRPGARALRDEMHRRLNIEPATVWAIDADALDGLRPLQDAGNYLEKLATTLQKAG